MPPDFFVASTGNDQNPGTADKPFGSLARARDAVRELKKNGLAKDILVVVRGGTYRLPEPLVFGPGDSGAAGHSITYAAAPGETPVLSGGRAITGWKKGDGQLWTADLPDVKAGKWTFAQLFVNGRRAIRARSPNDGFFRVEKAGPDNRTSFTFRKGDLRPLKNTRDAELLFLHDWCVSRVRIAGIDEAASTIRLADPIGCSGAPFYAISGFEPNPRYRIENSPELLDAPGEWYLDTAAGMLSYWPLPGEDMTKADAVAPALTTLLAVRSNAAKHEEVQNLRFVGLTFSHCEFPLPEHGYAEGQAGFYEERPAKGPSWGRLRNPGAVVFEATVGCVLESCEVSYVGGSGVSLEGPCRDNRIVGCNVRDIGGNGIMVGETSTNPALLAKNNAVSNNFVHHCALIYHGCIGIWAGITEATTIAHNEISDLPYTGISVGWQWDPKPTPCKGNRIEFNHIHHVMLLLSDGGGIYTLGRQPGTALRGNVIHDIPANAGRAESNGFFNDEGSSELLLESNTFYSIARAPIRFHKAEKNTVRNNTFVLSPGVRSFTFNACGPETMTFENNTERTAGVRTERDGRIGRALLCDGVASCVTTPHAPELEPAQLTIEAWVRLTDYPGGNDPRRWIVNKNANEWQQGHYALIVSGKDVGAYLNIGGGRDNLFAAQSKAGPLQLNRWHHIAMTFDGKTLAVFCDGTPAGSVPVNKPRQPGNSSLDIGRRQDAYNYFAGLIDEVRLYSRALDPAEIRQHAAAPDKIEKDKALIRHWDFEGEAGLTAKELLGAAGLESPYRERLLPAK